MGSSHLINKLNTFGCDQPQVVSRLKDLLGGSRNPSIGTTGVDGIVSVMIHSRSPDLAQSRIELETATQNVRDRLGPLVFGCDSQTLQESLVDLLRERGKTVVTGESCTGGLIGKMITDIPGSSAVYRGGWITYCNAMKVAELGVPQDVLDQHGAVSQPVACLMARGAIERSDADMSVAITGIAGPDGGSSNKPVGTVWIAIGKRRGEPESIPLRLCEIPRERAVVRDRAAKFAIQALRYSVLGHPIGSLTDQPEARDFSTDTR